MNPSGRYGWHGRLSAACALPAFALPLSRSTDRLCFWVAGAAVLKDGTRALSGFLPADAGLFFLPIISVQIFPPEALNKLVRPLGRTPISSCPLRSRCRSVLVRAHARVIKGYRRLSVSKNIVNLLI
jgi:hypothetical protein